MSSEAMKVSTPTARVMTPQKSAEAAENAAATKAHAQPAPEPSAEQIKQATQQLEAYLRSSSRSLEFSVDKGSGRTVVTVRDSQSGEVIRQMPSEEVLRLAQMAQGDTARLLSERV